MKVSSWLFLSLMAANAFAFDVNEIKQHLFKNGTCLLFGNYLNNVTLHQKLFEDQLMILTNDIELLFRHLHVATAATFKWDFLDGLLRTALMDSVNSLAAFIEDTVKSPLCSVLLLGPTGHRVLASGFKASRVIIHLSCIGSYFFFAFSGLTY